MVKKLIAYLKKRLSKDCIYCVHADKNLCLKFVRYKNFNDFLSGKDNSTFNVPYTTIRENDCEGIFFKRKK